MNRYLIFLSCFAFSFANAYELGTHARLTSEAYKRTVLSDAQFLSDLGLDGLDPSNPFGNIYYDISGNQISQRTANVFEASEKRMPDDAKPLSISGWFMRGAIREDDLGQILGVNVGDDPHDDPYGSFFRVLNHFYDPVNNQPLTINGIKPGSLLFQPNETAPKWAMGASDVFATPNTPDGNRRNHFTVFDARQAMYRALTGRDVQGNPVGRDAQGNPVPATEADRNKYWATTFRALGDVVHLLQDMGQPQHTRNEPHAGMKLLEGIVGHKSVFENYIDARATGTKFKTTGATPIDVSAPALTYDGYPIPSFTNYLTYFTTRNKDAGIYDRKGLADYSNRGFFTAGKNMGNTDYAYPLNTPNTYLLEKVYTDWQGNPLPNGSYVTLLKDIVPDTVNPALGGGAKPLTTYGLFDQFLTAPKLPSYTLNRYNYDAMADLLIPRSVAYSAGLINYFFRGKIDFVPDPDNAGAYLIKNLSSEAMTGTFTLYYDDVNGARQPVPGATWNLTIAANSQYGFVSFTPPTSPVPKVSGEYMLVFNGDVGEERATPGVTVGVVAAKKIKTIGTVYAGSDNTSQGTRAVLWKTPTTIINLGVLPGGTTSIAYGVSKKGAVVTGQSASSQGNRAFRWTEATGMQDLGTLPGGTSSEGLAISSDGTIIAGQALTTTTYEAFRWTEATGMQSLGPLPEGTYTMLHGMSANGQWLIGQYGDENYYKSFRWSEATGLQELFTMPNENWHAATAISEDGSTIAGHYYDNYDEYNWVWTEATGKQRMPDLPGYYDTEPHGISADGSIIVGTTMTGGYSRGFKWTAATGYEILETQPTITNSAAAAISADGKTIVGYSAYRATVWTINKPLQFLPDLEGGYNAGISAIAQ